MDAFILTVHAAVQGANVRPGSEIMIAPSVSLLPLPEPATPALYSIDATEYATDVAPPTAEAPERDSVMVSADVAPVPGIDTSRVAAAVAVAENG
jgi:hypothetical protein